VVDAQRANSFLDPVLCPEQGDGAVGRGPISRHEHEVTNFRPRCPVDDVQAMTELTVRPDPVRGAGREHRVRAPGCGNDARRLVEIGRAHLGAGIPQRRGAG
jgi:hypothetical protein